MFQIQKAASSLDSTRRRKMQTNTINKDILVDVKNLSIGFEVSKKMLKAVENV